ncbi:OLC1v1033776C1 [Oldenlandia corymbosa var. corymbosa]|uniref:Kinesin-like protein n=1 Tax=Oldenlandia corymbosa var. corymbosa TaxID=529605 RepID=A0AAV1CQG1_OLDCO|nr:OLC1v1033776C1 [Oldenlandia corymbosa var. corymbosa]
MRFGTPATPSSMIKKAPSSTPGGGPRTREEKILVTVRVRPLSPKEQAAYDLIAWEFIDEHTITSKNLTHERPSGPYTFDKVFDLSCSNQKVYEEGARDVAISVLSGINATIFAYGQTSSGKTFTMRGITENAILDIYEHIAITPEREFALKFSALEIYNETVVDLLNRDSGSLRLLDDPEKGTIVEKQTEEVVKDAQHLRHLIGICEAQRQVGETALNDKSSRSHQIIKLTIESSLREPSGCLRSLLASLYLVDLAGSERVSQTNTNGARLKEGSHINRSLLTLTTVIRKLSSGMRSGHIPYRDSKLTRILQSSLGGNARTAIVCTMSPALTHVEQSRNTLNFATSAKEVRNNAQVNLVVPQKQLVKHLQEEVARLQAEHRSPEPFGSSTLRSLLMEKELKIQQMEIEMNELKRQRDIAESQLELERRAHKEPKGSNHHGPSRQVVKCLSFSGENESISESPLPRTKPRKMIGRQSGVRQSSNSPSMLVHEIRKLEMRQKQLGEEANRALELLHKEVASHRLGSQDATASIAKLLSEIKEMQAISCIPEKIDMKDKGSLKEEIARLDSQESTIASLEEKLENVQRSIDNLVMCYPSGDEMTPDQRTSSLKKKKVLPFSLSNATNMQNIIRSPCSPSSSSCKIVESGAENRAPENTPRSAGTNNISSMEAVTPVSKHSNSVDMRKMQKMFKKAAEENIRSIKAYVTELKERVAKLQYQKQLLVCQVLQMEANESSAADETDAATEPSPATWQLVFEDQRKQIVMLWHLCHVSLVHRTQFYLLFKGDPSDQIYMEVELRRLTWLEQHLADLGNASPALLGDDPASFVSSSIRALKQEREYLAKRVSIKLSAEEREMLYLKWNVPSEGKGKPKRRLQLANKLWTDPLDMQHIKESAEIVAKLVGFGDSGENASKEMFELNFVSPCDKKTWMGWNLISNLLHL